MKTQQPLSNDAQLSPLEVVGLAALFVVAALAVTAYVAPHAAAAAAGGALVGIGTKLLGVALIGAGPA